MVAELVVAAHLAQYSRSPSLRCNASVETHVNTNVLRFFSASAEP